MVNVVDWEFNGGTLRELAYDCEGVLKNIAYGGNTTPLEVRRASVMMRRAYRSFVRSERESRALLGFETNNIGDYVFDAYDFILELGKRAKVGAKTGEFDEDSMREDAENALCEYILFPDEGELVPV